MEQARATISAILIAVRLSKKTTIEEIKQTFASHRARVACMHIEECQPGLELDMGGIRDGKSDVNVKSRDGQALFLKALFGFKGMSPNLCGEKIDRITCQLESESHTSGVGVGTGARSGKPQAVDG